MAIGQAHGRAMQMAGPRPDARDGVLPFAADGFRDWFVPKFAQWLQGNFDDIEHVSRSFRVRHSTAANWWNARNCLTGEMAAVAFMTFPAAVGWFLAEWEDQT